MKKDSNLFYFSNYNKDHPLCDSINKNVIAKFKNECPQEAITEFTGLKSKMYSIQTETKTKKTVKGVKKSVINLDHYKDCRSTLFDKTSMRKPFDHNYIISTIMNSQNGVYLVSMTNDGFMRMGSIRGPIAIVK